MHRLYDEYGLEKGTRELGHAFAVERRLHGQTGFEHSEGYYYVLLLRR